MRLSLYFEQVLSFSTSCSWLDSDPNVKCFLWFGAELCWVVSHHVEWNTPFTPKNTFSYKQWNKWMNETMLKVFYVLRQTQIVCNHQTKCIFLLVCEAETAKDPSDWLRTSNERVYSMWLHEVNVYSCLCVGILIVCGGFGPVKHLSNHKKPLKKDAGLHSSGFLHDCGWTSKRSSWIQGKKRDLYLHQSTQCAASQPAGSVLTNIDHGGFSSISEQCDPGGRECTHVKWTTGQGVSEKQSADGDGVVSHHLSREQPHRSVCSIGLATPSHLPPPPPPSLFLSLSLSAVQIVQAA